MAVEDRRTAVVIVGGGPAGLMAADVLAERGIEVHLHDAMPSVGTKFLLAGKGGLNLTHSEPIDRFVARYGARARDVARWLDTFGPGDVRAWARSLGVDTFVGSSGRVFPEGMGAAALLDAWVQRLRSRGVVFHLRSRWTGFGPDGTPTFSEAPLRSGSPAACGADPLAAAGRRPEGESEPLQCSGAQPVQGAPLRSGSPAACGAVLLALGGGSWPSTGSDGAWVAWLRCAGVGVAPLRPANCGFAVAWSDVFRQRFQGQPLKSVALAFDRADGTVVSQKGECLVTAYGMEGSLVYAHSAALRDAVEEQGRMTVRIDLLPGRSEEQVREALAADRGKRSWAAFLQRRLGLAGVKAGLLREGASASDFEDPDRLARRIKGVPVTLLSPRPIEEAISSAGGVCLEELDPRLMLKKLPGVFCAGEMLDWEAPTGGYLITACMASGRFAALAITEWLRQPRELPGP